MPTMAMALPTAKRRRIGCPSSTRASTALGTSSSEIISATMPEVRCISAR